MATMQNNIFGRSGNPTLTTNVFENEANVQSAKVMTIQGTVNKCFLLLAIVFAGAYLSWQMTGSQEEYTNMIPYLIGSGIAGFILAMVTVFNKKASPLTAPVYSLVEGFFLGIISLFFERMYPGIVTQAVSLTFGILLSLLLVYKLRIIKVTMNFRLGVAAATGGLVLLYLFNFVLRLFGMSVPFIHESSLLGIGFSLFVIVIASLNLVLDFDFIERGAEVGAPKYMEWYGAFGLMVTLIWLYIEILRLLSKLRKR